MDGAFNRVSGRAYSLINQMILKNDGEYATFKQWSNEGGKIKKGEKSELVVFWKMYPVEEDKEDGTKGVKTIPLLKWYNVFHISQVEGVKPLEKDILKPTEPIAEAEKVKNEYILREKIKLLEIVTNEAFYSPKKDCIQVPCREQYENVNEFYSTIFHEIIHSTGCSKRLNRFSENDASSIFGSEKYSQEELAAEIGSAIMLNILGIETGRTFKNSSAYIQSWLRVLKNDVKFIVSAAAKAEKAVKFILNNDNGAAKI